MKIKKLNRTLCLGLMFLVVILSLSGCGSNQAKEDVIKIGYVGALSGDTAVWGQAGLNGMKLTAKEINEKGGILGKKVEVIGLDGRGNPVDSVNAFNKLVDEEKVIAVIGTNFSSCNIAMAPIADQKKIPLIGTACSNPKVTVDENGKLHPYSFRIGFIDPFQGKVLATFATKELKAKTAAIITDIGSDYSTGLTEFFIKQFEQNGGKVLIKVDAHSGDNDFRAQLSKIAPLNPDVVLVPWIYKDVALIANQARELGIKATLLGGDGWDSKELLSMAGPALEGCYYTSQPSFANPATKPYAEAYKKEFGINPETEALFGHDGLYWIKDALERAGKVDPTALKDALENTKDFKGLMGSITVDPATHNPTKPCSVYQIKSSQFEYVGDFTP
ncbi:MAG: branched-chain amino acid transport system substrate-binding protein [Tepidanaerobacteraceae bacterium]|nr:amino acid/amide transporter substrate-binding protein family [Peptococcaceae bacterium]MDI3481846.1 branched-chain amino acid transport system substrate-binding protein [Tepidanaerobacteraceae bacterium]